MPMNGALLLQIANPKLPELPDPIQRAMTGFQLLNARQQNQAGALDLQQKQQDLAKGHAIVQALTETGGDVEKALPKIAQIAPDLLPHYQKLVDDQRMSRIQEKLGMRSAAMENFKFQEGAPAEERQVGETGAAAPPSVIPDGGVAAPIQAPIAKGFSQEMPVDPVTIPGVPELGVPSVTRRPETFQQLQRRKFDEFQAQHKAQLQAKLQDPYTLGPGEQRRSGSALIAQGATKPEPPEVPHTVTTADGVMQFDPKTKTWFKIGNRPPTAASTTTGSADDAKSIADAIIHGDQPPMLTGLYRLAGPVRAELARNGFDLSTATRDWNAIQKHLSTLNGAQQERLRQAVSFTYDSLDNIEDLYKEWKQKGSVVGIKLFNRAALATAKQLPGEAGAIAQNLEAQINDLTSELGTVYKGGNASTDETLRLAAENLKAEWNDATFTRALGQIRKNLNIRKNSILTSQPAGVSPNSPYNRQAPPPSKQSDGWSVKVVK